MSNEMLQNTIDLVSSLEVKNETQQIAKYELIEYTERLHKENQELKKQLEEMDSKLLFTKNELELRQKSIDNKSSQQNEFIEYLENEIKNSDICDVYVRGMKFNSAEKMIYKDILSKYKEIIGIKDE